MNGFLKTFAVLTVGIVPVANAWSFGPRGHKLVGAIADRRLEGTATANQLSTLLEGMSLEKAALLADDLKSLDRVSPSNPNPFHIPGHPHLEADLIAFHTANAHQHREFHFVDVPVEGNSKYASGTTGRSDIDLIHMIPVCFDVLSGKTPENNPRKITKRVAAVLLAHYVGDLHQPLHVGAQYFDDHGKPTNPDTHMGAGHPDKGGNNLMLIIVGNGASHHSGKLHSFWDGDSVESALELIWKEMRTANPQLTGPIKDADVAKFLALKNPSGIQIPPSVTVNDAVIGWADGMLPAARAAHSRLDYIGIHVDVQNKFVSGRVSPKPNTGDYREFAGKTIQSELPLAGARLAELMKKAVP